MKKRRGRPKQKGSKNCRFTFRLSSDEDRMLKELSALTGESKSDLLMQGLKMVNNLKRIQFEEDVF